MARLNDPPQPSSDSYETLRKKLMRQNKDLARSNSIQSLKIRQLDNDCARLLSENLDLRGQVLRLEKELEDSRLQRIADHALEIKAKMEAQLVEWGSLLAGLGMEPPAKRRDHVGRRQSQQPRTSIARRSPLKTLRNVARDLEDLEALEARAKEEGRLTPIRESRMSSRQTLDNDEILALRSEAEAADISGSSDLGPPPISQFIDEGEVKGPDSQNEPEPSSEPVPESDPDAAPEPLAKTEATPETKQEVKPQAPKTSSRRPPTSKPTAASSTTKPPPEPSPPQDLPTPSVRAGSKRKLAARDDAENTYPNNISTAALLPPSRRKSAVSKERTGADSQKELAVLRPMKDTKDQPPTASTPARKPLAAKSTNEGMTTPRNMVKKLPDDTKASKTLKQKVSKETMAKETSRRKTATAPSAPADPTPPATEAQVVIATPEPKQPAVAVIDVLSPMTPNAHPQPESRGDTPPPADISWKGEASRPSRRTRGVAISYAEPNLRDKMRRPTKELVDAVKGEGKYRRTSSLVDGEIAPMEGAGEDVAAKMEPRSEGQPSRVLVSVPEPVRDDVGSSLVEKGAVGDDLPSSVSTARGKRRSSFMARSSVGEGPAVHKDDGGAGHDTEDSIDISLSSSLASESSSVDVYEFPTNSPSKADPAGPPEHPARQSRASRRVSTAGHTELSLEREEAVSKSSATRKRGPVSGLRRSRLEPEQGVGENGGESSIGAGARDRSMRRKSTML